MSSEHRLCFSSSPNSRKNTYVDELVRRIDIHQMHSICGDIESADTNEGRSMQVARLRFCSFIQCVPGMWSMGPRFCVYVQLQRHPWDSLLATSLVSACHQCLLLELLVAFSFFTASFCSFVEDVRACIPTICVLRICRGDGYVTTIKEGSVKEEKQQFKP